MKLLFGSIEDPRKIHGKGVRTEVTMDSLTVGFVVATAGHPLLGHKFFESSIRPDDVAPDRSVGRGNPEVVGRVDNHGGIVVGHGVDLFANVTSKLHDAFFGGEFGTAEGEKANVVAPGVLLLHFVVYPRAHVVVNVGLFDPGLTSPDRIKPVLFRHAAKP